MRSRLFNLSNLVLVQHTKIEKSLDQKAKLRYKGPYQVVQHNQGSTYNFSKLSKEGVQEKYAVFRILPYIARNKSA